MSLPRCSRSFSGHCRAAQAKRIQVGAWVLIFLGVLTLFVWRLNAAYWKEVT